MDAVSDPGFEPLVQQKTDFVAPDPHQVDLEWRRHRFQPRLDGATPVAYRSRSYTPTWLAVYVPIVLVAAGIASLVVWALLSA